jgi:hypothetical protein
MKNNQSIKIFFGIVIFLFSLSLAYFTASYMRTNNLFDYWGALALFACAYVIIGIAISMIFSISLGFLFAADILILHLLFQYYGNWADAVKLTMIGAILVVLYVAAGFWLKDKPQAIGASAVAPSSSPVPPPSQGTDLR